MATEWERRGIEPPKEPPTSAIEEASSPDPETAEKGEGRLAKWFRRYDVPEGAAEREAKRVGKIAARYGIRQGRKVAGHFLDQLDERLRERRREEHEAAVRRE